MEGRLLISSVRPVSEQIMTLHQCVLPLLAVLLTNHPPRSSKHHAAYVANLNKAEADQAVGSSRPSSPR